MSGPAHDHVCVLLVEDDPGDALMVRESFTQAGKDHHFHVVTDGHQALRFLRRASGHAGAPRPGLIILDLNLPIRPGCANRQGNPLLHVQVRAHVFGGKLWMLP